MGDALHLYVLQFFLVVKGLHTLYCHCCLIYVKTESRPMPWEPLLLASDKVGLMRFTKSILESAFWLEGRVGNEQASLSMEVIVLI